MVGRRQADRVQAYATAAALGRDPPGRLGLRSLPWGSFVRWSEFSPTNSRQLAYTATGRVDPATGHVVQGTRGVFTLDLQGDRNRQIPPDRIRGLAPLGEPALTWMPNGRRLAFIERSTDLVTIRLNGTHKRRALTLPGGGSDLTWRSEPPS